MSWEKVTFYYANNLSSLSATSEVSGFEVDNIIDMFEGTSWKATSNADQYITFDNTTNYTCDYIALNSHNLFSGTATLSLEYSSDNFSSDINDAFTPFTPTSDKSFVKVFTSASARYWRVKVSGSPSANAQIGICIFGEKTELDWVNVAFDPHKQNFKVDRVLSQNGYLVSSHIKYVERQLSLVFASAEIATYDKIKTWIETNRTDNFFVSWDPGDHSEEVFLMRPSGNFNNPFSKGGLYRNISIQLLGRKED